MRTWRQLGIAIALMLALPFPAAVACFAAGTDGSAAEHACCGAMKMACEAESNPVSQGCCVKAAAVHRPEATTPKTYVLQRASADAGILVPAIAVANLRGASSVPLQHQDHPPGQPSPGAAPLRL